VTAVPTGSVPLEESVSCSRRGLRYQRHAPEQFSQRGGGSISTVTLTASD
jgi:hypothetical protein